MLPNDIRRATALDAPALTRIALAAKRHWGYPEEWLEAWTPILTVTPEAIAQHATWVVEVDGSPAGFVMLVNGDSGWWIDHLWLLPEYHGHGVGRRLFETALAAAHHERPGPVWIEADPQAAAFYEHCGARQVGSNLAPVLGIFRELPVLEIASAAPAS